ncbi:YcdB/YcdC domain-containing protein [Gordoniibacillus kamchatkensis]|uniref:YcdB/YcdC domain-containing protein n=1 Tax=Gordoniibacillus kamchatkensis TaxID=1590651 RepID=UPI000696BD50|nr:YcdB/YcdC domain-containing protein [Paenibacillus sp. VKM B-2647]
MKLLKTIGTFTLATALFGSPLAMADEAVPEPAMPAATSAAAPAIAVPVKPADEKTLAEAKITKEQAIELAGKAVSIPEGFTLQNVNLYGGSYMQQGPVWNLNYVKKQGDQYLGNLSVQIHGITGKMVGYSTYNSDPSYKPSFPPKVDYQGAKDVAAKWLAKVNPEALEQTKYNDAGERAAKPPLRGSVQYELRYDRVVNGIPFPQNFVSVVVNGDGEVVGYNANWTDGLTFDDPKGVLDADAALGKLHEQAEPTLAYITPYSGKNKKPILVYGMGVYPIDAKTGAVYTGGGIEPDLKPNLTPLTDKPLGSIPSATLSLSKDEAIAKATQAFPLPDGAKLQDASFYENVDDATGKTFSTWNLRWSTAKSDMDAKMGLPTTEIYAGVNAKTGEITNFSQYVPTQNNSYDVKVKQDEAKTKAIELVKKMLPGYTNQLVLQTIAADNVIPLEIVKRDRGYNFTFARYIDGVRAGYDSVNVTIDGETGAVRNYSANFSQQDYPAQKPQAIDSVKAEDLLFSTYDVQLQYVNKGYMPPFMPMGPFSDDYYRKLNLRAASGEVDNDKTDTTAHLIYALVPKYANGPQYVLNAETGGWISPESGDPVSLEKVKVTDIEGHWAQQDLQLMLDYQALDVKDGKVNPDAPSPGAS